jgi:alpha-tubulin suppressor-like RCC1 family protein
MLYVDAGKLYGWGSNKYGQLGLGAISTSYGSPVHVSVYKKNRKRNPGDNPWSLHEEFFSKVAAGWDHSLALSGTILPPWIQNISIRSSIGLL